MNGFVVVAGSVLHFCVSSREWFCDQRSFQYIVLDSAFEDGELKTTMATLTAMLIFYQGHIWVVFLLGLYIILVPVSLVGHWARRSFLSLHKNVSWFFWDYFPGIYIKFSKVFERFRVLFLHWQNGQAGQTGATGDRLKEGSMINKSLSALGRLAWWATSTRKGTCRYFSPTAESFGVSAKLGRFREVPTFQVRVPSKGSGRFRVKVASQGSRRFQGSK